MRRVVLLLSMRRVVLLLCAVLQANGFHAAPPPQRPSTLLRASPLSSIPVGSIVLGALAIGSVGDLVVEVPKLGGEGADYVGTLLDAAFLGYATKTLGAQSGLLADAAPATTVEGLELCANQIFNPTSMFAYSNVLTRSLPPCFENSLRAIDSSKNQPNRLRFDRAREF